MLFNSKKRKAKQTEAPLSEAVKRLNAQTFNPYKVLTIDDMIGETYLDKEQELLLRQQRWAEEQADIKSYEMVIRFKFNGDPKEINWKSVEARYRGNQIATVRLEITPITVKVIPKDESLGGDISGEF